VGVADRERLDQYFTGIRHLEHQLQQRLEKPEPIASCRRAAEITVDAAMGQEQDGVSNRHRMMTDLLVMALACDQTRVFNMTYTPGFASTIRPGYEKPHHTATHEEPLDDALGYQLNSSWFTRNAMRD